MPSRSSSLKRPLGRGGGPSQTHCTLMAGLVCRPATSQIEHGARKCHFACVGVWARCTPLLKPYANTDRSQNPAAPQAEPIVSVGEPKLIPQQHSSDFSTQGEKRTPSQVPKWKQVRPRTFHISFYPAMMHSESQVLSPTHTSGPCCP